MVGVLYCKKWGEGMGWDGEGEGRGGKIELHVFARSFRARGREEATENERLRFYPCIFVMHDFFISCALSFDSFLLPGVICVGAFLPFFPGKANEG